MRKERQSFIVNAAEIISYAKSRNCTAVATDFLSGYTIGTNDNSYSQTLINKGFAKIKDNKILLEPAIKFLFDNICSAQMMFSVIDKTFLLCPSTVLMVKKRPSNIDKLVITPFKDIGDMYRDMIRNQNHKVIANGINTDITLKEFISKIQKGESDNA